MIQKGRCIISKKKVWLRSANTFDRKTEITQEEEDLAENAKAVSKDKHKQYFEEKCVGEQRNRIKLIDSMEICNALIHMKWLVVEREYKEDDFDSRNSRIGWKVWRCDKQKEENWMTGSK